MAQSPQPNFNAMRQDAIRRSREMQRRASVRQPNIHTPAQMPEQPLHVSPPPSSGLPSELEHLLHGWDGERLALLGLLYFLYKEGADARLLLAIAYILL